MILSDHLFAVEGNSKVLLYHSLHTSNFTIDKTDFSFITAMKSGESFENAKKYLRGHTAEKIINHMKIRHMLVDKKNPITLNIWEITPPPINNLRLILTEKCNLNCNYCYERKSNAYCNKRNMPYIIAKKAIDEFININQDHFYPLFIRFFGGEPLLRFELIKKSIEYMEQKHAASLNKIQFLLNTNGTLITEEIARYCKKKHIQIALSLDGDQELHDATRKYMNGKGSFLKIEKNLHWLVENQCYFNFSTVCTDHNLPQLPRYLDYLKKTQIEFHYPLSTNFTFLHIDGGESVDTISTEKKIAYLQTAIQYAKKKNINVFGGISHFPFQRFMEGNIGRHCCGIGSEACVSPTGDIYPCAAQTVKIGTVYDFKKVREHPFYQKLLKRIPGNIPECHGCEIEGFCAGGCAARMKLPVDNFEKRNKECELLRKTFQILVKEYLLKD